MPATSRVCSASPARIRFARLEHSSKNTRTGATCRTSTAWWSWDGSSLESAPKMTRRLAVIGWPLGHTLSPAIHRAAIESLGLELSYDALETAPDGLEGC